MATVFSADYVRARWAYSELRSPRQGHRYTGRVQDLKDKSTQGVAFHALSQDELNQLIRLFNDIRGPEFNMYLGETGFVLTHWTKDQLGMVTILPSYKFRLLARGVAVATFKQWAEATELATDSAGPFAHDDPITVIRYDGSTILIDGYGRASSFWGTNDAASKIEVFVPE